MFEFALMVALVYTKLMCTVQTTYCYGVSSTSVRFQYVGPEWYTGSKRHGYGVPLRYASYHKVCWYERTAYRSGTAPYQSGTLNQKYNGTAYCYDTLRTVKSSQAPDTSTQRAVSVRIVLFRYGTPYHNGTAYRAWYGVPLIFY